MPARSRHFQQSPRNGFTRPDAAFILRPNGAASACWQRQETSEIFLVSKVETKRPRGRPRAPDAEKKRQEILSHAAALFADQGFHKTPFAAVAEAVGMTLPGLTHYFPRKIDLLLSVLDGRDKEMFPDGYPINEDNPFRGLDAVMARDVSRGAQLTRLYLVLSAEALSEAHPAHDWFKARFDRIARSLNRALTQLQDKGILRPEIDCMAEAHALLAMMEGLQLRWLRAPDAVDAVDIYRHYLATKEASILAPRAVQ